MSEDYCFWTVAPGRMSQSAQAMVLSAREAGIRHEFHVWTDGAVGDANHHSLGRFDPTGGLFRLTYLRDAVAPLPHRYFVWLDPRTRFLSKPDSLLRALADAPVHIPLTFDLSHPPDDRLNWSGYPCGYLAGLMRQFGIANRSIFAASSAISIVHRDAVNTVSGLAYEFWQRCDRMGSRLSCEPLLAYVMQMLCGDSRRHLLAENPDLWGITIPNTAAHNHHYPDQFAGDLRPAMLLVSNPQGPSPQTLPTQASGGPMS